MMAHIRWIPDECCPTGDWLQIERAVVRLSHLSRVGAKNGEAGPCEQRCERINVHGDDRYRGRLAYGFGEEAPAAAPRVHDPIRPPLKCPSHHGADKGPRGIKRSER